MSTSCAAITTGGRGLLAGADRAGRGDHDSPLTGIAIAAVLSLLAILYQASRPYLAVLAGCRGAPAFGTWHDIRMRCSPRAC